MLKKIKQQKITNKKSRNDFDSKGILCRFCYLFPQYQYEEARRLPYWLIIKMLQEAEKERARELMDMLNIVSAPHGKKGTVTKVKKNLEERMK